VPELPEVETIVRDLRPNVVGRRVEQVDLIRESVVRFPDPASFRSRLRARRIASVRRRGKFIHIGLGGGEDLVVHLGMTGTLTLRPLGDPLLLHTHLRLELDDGGQELRYRDPRRFGRVVLGHVGELRAAGALPRLGPEPLAAGFGQSSVTQELRSSRRAVKSVLLDQGVVAGCGNIYADEACFLARVRPDRPASGLSREQARRLVLALPLVMRQALRRRGTSFSDYRDGFGSRGGALEALLVYGRASLPCVRCGSTLQQTRVGGRTTVYCVGCQH
jgi:formamidopyrimidine-DNA glycosylase